VDTKGRLRAQLALAKEGSPGLWLMDEKGTARLNAGIYPDGTSYLGLQDKDGQMIELMRSWGPKESPLLIFKQSGQNRMITALNPAPDSVPFLITYDSKHARNLHFGKYDGP
jgi:hypothetical protein